MARTTAEIDADITAVRSILVGGRASVEYRGRKVQNFSPAELREVLAELKAERAEVTNTGRNSFHFATSKGLR